MGFTRFPAFGFKRFNPFGLAILWMAVAAGCSKPALSYPEQIAAWHSEKDQFMRESPQSPIPAERRAALGALPHFPVESSLCLSQLPPPAGPRPTLRNAHSARAPPPQPP